MMDEEQAKVIALRELSINKHVSKGDFDKRFGELILAAECPEPFVDWLVNKAKIFDLYTYGRLAPTESDVRAEILQPALADDVKFANIGEKACAVKPWIVCRAAMATEVSASLVSTASDAPLTDMQEKSIKLAWMNLHAFALPDGMLLVQTLQGKLYRELVLKATPEISAYLLERLRTLACLDKKSMTLLQVLPGKAAEGIEVISDSVTGPMEVFRRARAFFHTVAYLCIADPSMFDLQTAVTASEKILNFVQKTYEGRTPPVAFFVQAWAQTIHCFSEQLRMTMCMSLKEMVLNGNLWEAFWTSFQSGGGGPSSGALAIEDRDPNISAAVALARREAAQAQSARDRAANKEWWGNGNQANTGFGGGGGAPRQKKGGGKGGPKGAGNSKGGSKGGKRKRARHY